MLSDPIEVEYSDRDLTGDYDDSVESITLDNASVTIGEPAPTF